MSDPMPHDLGVGTMASSLLISVYYFANIAGRSCRCGALADRVDARYPYWLSTGLIWGTLLLTLGHPSYATLIAVSALIGMGGGGLLPVSSAMVGQKFGARSFGKVMGMVIPFFSARRSLWPDHRRPDQGPLRQLWPGVRAIPGGVADGGVCHDLPARARDHSSREDQ